MVSSNTLYITLLYTQIFDNAIIYYYANKTYYYANKTSLQDFLTKVSFFDYNTKLRCSKIAKKNISKLTICIFLMGFLLSSFNSFQHMTVFLICEKNLIWWKEYNQCVRDTEENIQSHKSILLVWLIKYLQFVNNTSQYL